MPNEEFEKLMREQNPSGYLARADNGEYIVPGIQKKWEGYRLRQPEIDALKAQIASDDRLLKIRGEGLNKTYAENTNLRAEIDALKAEVEMHEDMEKDFRRTISALTDVVADRKAEVERLRADAERYRFLQSEAYECVVPHGNRLNGSRTAWITKLHPGNTFDAAIDAAMKETK